MDEHIEESKKRNSVTFLILGTVIQSPRLSGCDLGAFDL